MNLFINLSHGMLLATLCATTATATFSGDTGGEAKGIELNSNGSTAHHLFDQLFAMGNLNESTLAKYAKSAQRTLTPMGGYYDRNGAEVPQLFGQQDLSRVVSLHAATDSLPDSVAVAQATAVHMVGSGAVAESAPPAIPAVSGSSTVEQVQTAVSPTTNSDSVPLPPSVLFLASGLLGLPVVRRRVGQTC